MTDKPLIVMDQHFRHLEELFRPETYDALADICRIEAGQNWPMDPARIDDLIGEATFHVSANPGSSSLARMRSAPAMEFS